MDAAERELLTVAVRDALAGAPGALDEIGWREMLAAEPRAAIDIVFTALGAANSAEPVLDDVVASALGIEPRPDLAVFLPPFGAWELSNSGLATARVATATELLIGATTVPISAVAVTPVRGIDPDAGFHSVRVEGVVSPSDAWDSAVALGRRALAHQIAGASRAMLDLARTHALERVQFGRPIARFQAVRHRLAEALVAIEALEAAVAAAGDDPNPSTAALAKALAGQTARSVAAHCQQVLAGIGFTTDHPFHTFMKRTMVLDGIFGSSDAIVLDIGHGLLATRKVPTLIDL